ncbi:hypothetical protein GCM10010218_18480 [Streptomyces mashuensis]|uniref:PPE family protein n=1 Tax=Streptomyces mashuensis TaxID=33904 RepID=A0A919B1U2_9ACTN|nr:hypothetical protein GCM10010218_18480 [Streptomyces mashuensis]
MTTRPNDPRFLYSPDLAFARGPLDPAPGTSPDKPLVAPMATPGPVIVRPGIGLAAWTNFDNMSLDQLRGMVEHADTEKAQHLVKGLKDAAEAIKKVGNGLKTHADKVDWRGDGGTAFREWCADMANATLRLSELTSTAGNWVDHATTTLASVKSALPPVSADDRKTLETYRAQHNMKTGRVPLPLYEQDLRFTPVNPSASAVPTQLQAFQAQQRLLEAQRQTAQQLKKLAGAYVWSARQIESAQRPTFRPMPPVAGIDARREFVPGAGGSAGGASAQPQGSGGFGGSGVAPGTMGSGGYFVPGRVGQGTHSTGPSHDRVDVDGVKMPPTVPTPSHDSRPGLPHRPPTDSGTHDVPHRPGPVVPNVPHLPPMPSSDPRTPMGRLGDVPRRVPTGPEGRVVVPPPGPTGRGPGATPGLPGRGGSGATGVPRVPNTGVIGGRATGPMPGRASSQQSPRGAAFGAEPSPRGTGQPGMGFGPVPGMAAGGAAGRSGGAAGGSRRLTSEPGGVVGGRPGRRAASEGGAFTPGGTGLVRGASEPNTGRVGQRRGGSRPGYAKEDEETWSQSRRRTIPPVIE